MKYGEQTNGVRAISFDQLIETFNNNEIFRLYSGEKIVGFEIKDGYINFHTKLEGK